MFEIFRLSERSSDEIGFSIAVLAILVVAIGYASDAMVKDSGYGPGGNGLIIVFGAVVGISAMYLYLYFFKGQLASNAFKAHMFDLQLARTGLSASTGALAFFLFMMVIKRLTFDGKI